MAFTCVPACRLAGLPRQPFSSKAFADLSPPPRLRLLLAGATVARRDLFPAENQTPFTAHAKERICPAADRRGRAAFFEHQYTINECRCQVGQCEGSGFGVQGSGFSGDGGLGDKETGRRGRLPPRGRSTNCPPRRAGSG
jgi:hypothetical protein